MSSKRKIVVGTMFAAVLAGVGVYAVGVANASVPAPVPSYVNVVPAAPRIVAAPGITLNAGQAVDIAVAGKTFGTTAVPANTTGVTVSISSIAPSAAGSLTVWTTEAGRPGTPSVNYKLGETATNVVTVGLNSTGKLSVYSSQKTRFLMALLAFNTPVPAPTCTPTMTEIPASSKTLTKVGGSIRSGATDFGSVTLPAGTYDTRVVGGFTGLNNDDTFLSEGTFLTGTLTVVKGAEINSTFTNNVTAGGVLIPKSNSDTLTQDPTVAISTFLVLPEPTDVHVKLFAYASNSSTEGSGEVKANVQVAQFRKVC